MLDPGGAHVCFTCELPWRDNAPETSCIPAGIYPCVPHNSPAHPGTWELQNVPNRSEILIHNGNTERDSLGCIVVGNEFGTIDGLPAVLNSQSTLGVLRKTLPQAFQLEIRWADPIET
jgi:hypothetical protein